MKLVARTLLVGALATASVTAWAAPSSAACIDDPSCVRVVVCAAGDKVNQVATKLGQGEPAPCD